MIMVDLGCDNRFCGRIHELGLRPGTRFTVTQKGAFGGRVLFVRGTRLAVDRGFAKTALVRPCIQFAQKLGLDQEKAALEAALALRPFAAIRAPFGGLWHCGAPRGLPERYPRGRQRRVNIR